MEYTRSFDPLPIGLSLVTKAASMPRSVVLNAPVVVGKSDDAVRPATYTVPPGPIAIE